MLTHNKFFKPERRRWLIVVIIFIAVVFNYVDRQIVSVLKPLLKAEFNLSDSGYAMIINVFTVFYAIMYPVTGWMVDRWGPKLVMFWGIIGWSLACIGGGISKTIGQFTFFRAMLGTSEPSIFPSQLKVVSSWFPGKLRATANSLSVAGSSIGAVIAPPVIVWLTLTFSWKIAFITLGLIGFIIGMIWILIYRDPPKYILQEATEENLKEEVPSYTWKQLWMTRSLWGILLIRFISDPVWYFCLFWLPGYLQEDSGLTLVQVGMWGWIPFLVADLGAVGASTWSDRLVRKGKAPLQSRKIMLSILVFAAPLCLLVPHLPNAATTILVFSIIALMCLTWVFTLPVVMSEVFPLKNVASVMGIAGGCGAAGAVLFNFFVGEYIGTIGASKVFIAMAFMHPLAVFVLWKFVKKERPIKK